MDDGTPVKKTIFQNDRIIFLESMMCLKKEMITKRTYFY